MTDHVVDATTMAEAATPEESSAVETKGDAMSDITRWKVSGPTTRLQPDANGPWVALVDYYRGIDRLIAERDAAQAEVERLKNAIDHLTSERDEARGEVERLTQNRDAWKKDCQELEQERNRAWDLGEELNRELEGQKAANQRLLRECAEDIASAKAREEAATTELNETREKLEEVQVQYDEFAKVTAKVIEQHQRERDHARQQVYRLQQAGADRPTDPSAQNLDMANGQAILDSSRPTDEDIWRDAFMRQLHDDHVPNWATTADIALAQYRKRWPR